MAEPSDLIIPILREMRVDIANLRTEMGARFDKNDQDHKHFRNALSADTLMGRLLTGEFEERIEKLESLNDRIQRLEAKVNAFEGRS